MSCTTTNINVEPCEEIEIQVGKVEKKNKKAAGFSVCQFQGRPSHQRRKYTKLHNILSIATVLKDIALF